MSNVATSEPSIEQCLIELRKLFPKSWCYVEVSETGDCSPRGKRDTGRSAWIQIDSSNGDILYNNTTETLNEAMAQVRQFWRKQQ